MEGIKLLIMAICFLGVIIICPILHFMGIETPTSVLFAMATTGILLLVADARDTLMMKIDVVSSAFANALNKK